MAAPKQEQLVKEVLARYAMGGEASATSRNFRPDYPVFRQYARTGAARYAPSLRADKFGRVFLYNPDKISIQEYDEMRMDGQVRAGLQLLKLPIMRSRWVINSQDKDQAAYVTEILKPVFPTILRHILLSLDFGYICGELLWELLYDVAVSSTNSSLNATQEKTYPVAISLRRMMLLDPVTYYVLAYKHSGEFAGVKQYTPYSTIVQEDKVFHFANEIEFDELHGISRLKPCYPYWFFKKSQYEWTNVGYETQSIPQRKVRYPDISIPIGTAGDGVTPQYIEAVSVAEDLAEGLANNNAVLLPSTLHRETNQPMWDVEWMETKFDGQRNIAYIDHLNAEILKSLLIPELALNVGQSGSYDLAQEQIRFFLLGLEALMDQIADAVSKQLVQRIIRYQFGRNQPKAYLKFQPLADDVKEGLTNVLFETIGQNRPIPLKDGQQMLPDWRKIAEDSGIPVDILTKEDLASYQAGLQFVQGLDAQQMGPDGQPMDGGGGDMPFDGGPPARGGYGAPGGASNRGDNVESGGGSDFGEDQQANFSEVVDGGSWSIVDGEMVWAPKALCV